MKRKMGQTVGQTIERHLNQHSSLYIFCTVLLFMGVVFGTLTVNSLGYHQQNDLFNYFQRFLTELEQDTFMDSGYAFYQNFMHSLTYIGFMWLLGLSIIGLPVILVMLFLKGVFVGFTVGFLVYQMGWDGFLFSLISVIPQNLILVPIMLVVAVLSISFSFKLISHLYGAKHMYKYLSLSRYIGVMLIVMLIIGAVSFFQTYVSPALMQLVY